ncbi:Hypothetical predicted protein [Lecanosticta acicola]|uniref:Uncharacterized protein n=1 Tax=Lecanosticta acicola TaxID=111012 RepID=A0AAI9E8T2_9PEZI|nr:Hypothetical predicted protein [Lecanosticta acicola]
MAQAAASTLPPKQKAQLHETADFLLEIYETLADMRYLDPKGIIRGPHEISKDLLASYHEHKLDPSIIYLYSILPYIDEQEAGQSDCFHGSSFADFRQPHVVRRGRDPLYADPDWSLDFDDDDGGPYMRPWYTPLSKMGNHQSVILYDAREHRIWVVDQEGWDTTDPGLVKGWFEEEEPTKEESTWGDSDGSSYDEEDDDDEDDIESHGSSEFWEEDEEINQEELSDLQREPPSDQADFDEGFELVEKGETEKSKNENSFEHIRFRPAGEFLRDVKRWYMELKELPGQGEQSHAEWRAEHAILRSLYRKNNWPSRKDFDGENFEVDLARAYCAQRAKQASEEPLRKVECFQGWSEHAQHMQERQTQAISVAKTPDDEWKARFGLWQLQERERKNLSDLRKAEEKAARLCPGGQCQREEDLPLWEFEECRVQLQWKRETIDRTGSAIQVSADDRRDRQYHEARKRHAEKNLKIYAKAYEASKADAERICPERAFQDLNLDRKSLGRPDTLKSISQCEEGIEEARTEFRKVVEWEEKELPKHLEIPETRKEVENLKEQYSKWEKSAKERKKMYEKWLEEHGNTD